MGKMTIAACTAVLAFTLGATSPSLAQTSNQGAMGMMNGHHMACASKLSGEPIYNAQGQRIGTHRYPLRMSSSTRVAGRRIAMHADKTDQSFAAKVHLAAAVINSR